jgi:N-acetylmuramoyl-L-alanine amidase
VGELLFLKKSIIILTLNFVIFCILLLIPGNVLAAVDHERWLYLGDQKVSSDIQIIAEHDETFINLPFLNKYFHMVSNWVPNNWDPDKGDIYLKFGTFDIKMHEGETAYFVNGEARRLSAAPFARDNQLWFPLQFILRLGLVVKSQTRDRLTLDWEQNYLLRIESVTYQDRPAFLLIGTQTLQAKKYLLINPDRLVLELPGVKAHFTFDTNISANPIVKKVRFSQPEPDLLKLVFDLSRLTGYQIIQEPDKSDQLLVVPNYFVTDVNFINDAVDRKITVLTSAASRFQTQTDKTSNRLIIDFEGATLAAKISQVPGDDKWIKAVRVAQFSPQTVRVVLDLLDSRPCIVSRSRVNPNLIEIKTAMEINRIDWSATELGGKLTIEANGALDEATARSKKPDQLRIDLNGAQFMAGLKAPTIQSSQIKGISLINATPTLARIIIDLNYFIGYDTQTSSDRRRLILNLRSSALIGKAIVIDPGHGGVDPGACGGQGIREKDVVLDVAMRLKDLLEEAGAAVVFTRTDDSFIGLYERSFMANDVMADLFISIHANFNPDSSVHGIEVYHSPDQKNADEYASCVLNELVKSTGLKGLGVKTAHFVVIRETQMPSILVELGFLSNFQEEATLNSSEFKDKAAAGILHGIMDYCQSQK